MLKNWIELLTDAMEENGETLEDVEYCTLDELDLRTSFDSGLGRAEGEPFTAWTKDNVYFPAKYDGAEWVASVPRNPCDKSTKHVGRG